MEFLLLVLILVYSFYIMSRIIDELFIASLDNIAKSLKLSPNVAGATLLAMGTSAPELSIALFSLFLVSSQPSTGLGSVVGSAIFQILVVIGFASLIKTTYLDWKPVIRDGVFYGISVFLLLIFIIDGKITLIESSTLVVGYFIYLVVLFFWSRYIDDHTEPDPIEMVEEEIQSRKTNPALKHSKNILSIMTAPIDFIFDKLPDAEKQKNLTLPYFFGSLFIIAFLSYWLVFAAENIAYILGIPAAIVALTILAGGSSIPELISSVIVAKQGRGDMSISNALGSNVFDILISLGLPLLIFNVLNGDLTDVGQENISSSIFLLLITLILVLVILVAQKFKIGKGLGILFILTYLIYVIAVYSGII